MIRSRISSLIHRTLRISPRGGAGSRGCAAPPHLRALRPCPHATHARLLCLKWQRLCERGIVTRALAVDRQVLGGARGDARQRVAHLADVHGGRADSRPDVGRGGQCLAEDKAPARQAQRQRTRPQGTRHMWHAAGRCARVGAVRERGALTWRVRGVDLCSGKPACSSLCGAASRSRAPCCSAAARQRAQSCRRTGRPGDAAHHLDAGAGGERHRKRSARAVQHGRAHQAGLAWVRAPAARERTLEIATGSSQLDSTQPKNTTSPPPAQTRISSALRPGENM